MKIAIVLTKTASLTMENARIFHTSTLCVKKEVNQTLIYEDMKNEERRLAIFYGKYHVDTRHFLNTISI